MLAKTVDIGGAAPTADEKDSWFVGLQFDELGPGSAGVEVGTQGSILESADTALMYEAYYSYPVNDGMTVTLFALKKEQTLLTKTRQA